MGSELQAGRGRVFLPRGRGFLPDGIGGGGEIPPVNLMCVFGPFAEPFGFRDYSPGEEPEECSPPHSPVITGWFGLWPCPSAWLGGGIGLMVEGVPRGGYGGLVRLRGPRGSTPALRVDTGLVERIVWGRGQGGSGIFPSGAGHFLVGVGEEEVGPSLLGFRVPIGKSTLNVVACALGAGGPKSQCPHEEILHCTLQSSVPLRERPGGLYREVMPKTPGLGEYKCAQSLVRRGDVVDPSP